MKKRIKQLDALRAVAILLVLGCHVTWHPLLLRFGWTGVDLFFVLSGFLIAGLLFREYKSHQALDVWRFLIRRGLKIYPAYYVLLLATMAFEFWKGHGLSWGRLWPDLVFVQNYRLGMWEHLWSIGTEEQFYLILPGALALLAFRKNAKPFACIPTASLCIITVCFLLRTGAFAAHTQASWFPGCIRGMDGLALGVMISYFDEFQPGRLAGLCRDRVPLLLLSLLCLMPAVLFPSEHPFMQTAGLTSLYAGYAGLLLFYLKCVNGTGKVMGLLAFVGSYSYTIYLFHMAVSRYLVSELSPYVGRNLLFALYLSCSVGLGIATAKVIERPALRIRERLMPSRV